MEEMASLWSYQETVDELRQQLLYTNLELEQLKAEKIDEMKKNKEYVKQLTQILKIVCQERDDAKDQLQKLLNKLDNNPTKANSSISESSETYNYHNSHNSSSKIDSFFDSISSPECSNNMAHCITQLTPKVDKASLVIDNLVKGKTLPQQGKLLQTVIETGSILQTLLVSGQLPQWRNPPQFTRFNIPQVSIKGCESDSYLSHHEMLSKCMLNFDNFDYGSCLENQSLMSAAAYLNKFVVRKRQRLY